MARRMGTDSGIEVDEEVQTERQNCTNINTHRILFNEGEMMISTKVAISNC